MRADDKGEDEEAQSESAATGSAAASGPGVGDQQLQAGDEDGAKKLVRRFSLLQEFPCCLEDTGPSICTQAEANCAIGGRDLNATFTGK
jgi:hypothetical protein